MHRTGLAPRRRNGRPRRHPDPGEPAPAAVRSAAEAVTLAVLLEHQVARAYLAMVALPEPRLRSLGARGLRDTAVRAAQWTGRPEAFPGLPPPARRPGRGWPPGAGLPGLAARGAAPRPGWSAAASAGLGAGLAVGAVLGAEHLDDESSGRRQVVVGGDPLGPRPPEPPQAVPRRGGVDVLGEPGVARVHDVQAWHPPGGCREPGGQAAHGELAGQMVEQLRGALRFGKRGVFSCGSI